VGELALLSSPELFHALGFSPFRMARWDLEIARLWFRIPVLLESRGHKSTGCRDRVASLAQHVGEDVPDMRHARPNFQLHGHIRFTGFSGQRGGIV